jgi:hypothetical protein
MRCKTLSGVRSKGAHPRDEVTRSSQNHTVGIQLFQRRILSPAAMAPVSCIQKVGQHPFHVTKYLYMVQRRYGWRTPVARLARRNISTCPLGQGRPQKVATFNSPERLHVRRARMPVPDDEIILQSSRVLHRNRERPSRGASHIRSGQRRGVKCSDGVSNSCRPSRRYPVGITNLYFRARTP